MSRPLGSASPGGRTPNRMQLALASGVPRGDLRAAIRKENARWGPLLQLVPREAWPPVLAASPLPPDAMLRSRSFLVQVFAEPDAVFRLSVNRADIDAAGKWKDGITWDELQAVKVDACRVLSERGAPDGGPLVPGARSLTAVECFPPPDRVVNVSPMRHLFLLPAAPPFLW